MVITNPTSTALWHDVIQQAGASCAVFLGEEIESYLVFLLMRYTNKPELVKYIVAPAFLDSLKKSAEARQAAYQEIGDTCLIFTGLFPQIAAKRLVKISYYVNLGQASYITLSKEKNDLYQLLATQFVPLMDVLQNVRKSADELPGLLPLEAYELWNETGSQHALKILRYYTSGIPVSLVKKKD